MQWPFAVAVVVSRESRDEKAELVRNCPSENKDVKIRSLAFYSSEFVRKITHDWKLLSKHVSFDISYKILVNLLNAVIRKKGKHGKF